MNLRLSQLLVAAVSMLFQIANPAHADSPAPSANREPGIRHRSKKDSAAVLPG